MGRLETYADAGAFLAAAHGYLRARPVETSVVSSAAQRIHGGEEMPARAGEAPHWFAVTRDGFGAVDAVAMRVGAYGAYLLDMAPDSSNDLARLVLERGERPAGANGDAPAAQAFAETVDAAHGQSTVLQRGTRLHLLETLDRPSGVRGSPREAVDADAPVLAQWMSAFVADVDRGLPRGSRSTHALEDGAGYVRAGIERSLAWIWADPAGEPASFAMARPPALGVARVDPVYTPPTKRCHGYAAAVTAHASAHLLSLGARVCLFTDLANPTSNAVYRRIGFEPVRDTVEIAIVDA